MKSTAPTVKDYLASLPKDRRDALQAVREVILKNLGKDYEEGMQYGMIGYYVPHRAYPAGYRCDPAQPLPFAGLASQKNHMSLYLMCVYGSPEQEARLRERWAGTGKRLDMGRSCIRFKRLDDLPLEIIAETIRSVPAAKYIEHCTAGARGTSTGQAVSRNKAATTKAAPKKAVPAKAARYNGMGQRISWIYNNDSTLGVGAGDKTYFFIYDDKWRPVATYREANGTLDTYAKEVFVYHDAGLDGSGGSSYIDAVVLKKLDNTNGWTGAEDSTLELTYYLCQNWRGDVSVVLKPNGGSSADVISRVKYSSYGYAFGMPGGDSDCDGDLDAADLAELNDGDAYKVIQDVDLDGDNDAADVTAAGSAVTLGRGVLGPVTARVRKGYAGYELDTALAGAKYHVRYRVLDAELSRDPEGYIDGLNLYGYVQGMAVATVDPMGLCGGDDDTPWYLWPLCLIPGGCAPAPSPPAPPAGCTTPNPDPAKPPTSAECCDAMKKAGCSGTDIAGVVCCNGKKIVCIWSPATGPGSTFINECFEEHEKDHFSDITCDGCGTGQICRPPFKNGKDPNKEECSAYTKEINCYNTKKKKCNDKSLTPQQQKDCKAAIDTWLKDACNIALKYCGKKPSGCP